jgi:hypothetical protein
MWPEMLKLLLAVTALFGHRHYFKENSASCSFETTHERMKQCSAYNRLGRNVDWHSMSLWHGWKLRRVMTHLRYGEKMFHQRQASTSGTPGPPDAPSTSVKHQEKEGFGIVSGRSTSTQATLKGVGRSLPKLTPSNSAARQWSGDSPASTRASFGATSADKRASRPVRQPSTTSPAFRGLGCSSRIGDRRAGARSDLEVCGQVGFV